MAAPTPVSISDIPNPATKITDISIAGILTGGGFNLFDFIFFAVGVFFLTGLLFASIRYITSEGDPKKISDASARITNSLLGLVIVFTSFVVVKIVASIFGYGVSEGSSIVPF